MKPISHLKTSHFSQQENPTPLTLITKRVNKSRSWSREEIYEKEKVNPEKKLASVRDRANLYL